MQKLAKKEQLQQQKIMTKHTKTNSFTTANLVMGGLFLALGLALPFLTAQLPQLGNKILPMHIPVLLCGFFCGSRMGGIVGFVTPLLRSFLFTMPPLMPTALAMAFELSVYGIVAGLVYMALRRTNFAVFVALVSAMLAGRLVWGGVSYVIFQFMGMDFTWKFFMAGAFFNAIPGIIIQLILIPFLVIVLEPKTYFR